MFSFDCDVVKVVGATVFFRLLDLVYIPRVRLKCKVSLLPRDFSISLGFLLRGLGEDVKLQP